MSISNTTSRVQYTVTSAGATYNVTFRFYDAEDLTVVHTSILGVDTTLVYSVGYSVAGAGEPDGGQVTLLDLAITDGTLTIIRTAALDQETTAPFTAEAYESALDKLAMHTQQLQRQMDRAVRFGDVSGTASPVKKVDAAGMLLGFGSGGDVALVDPSTLIPTPITDMVQKSGDTMTGELGLPSAKFSGAIPTHSAGRVFYSTDENTLCYYNDVSGVTVNLGRELLIRVRNNTGSTILNGQVVYVSGALGQNPTAALAKADAEATSKLIGVATHDIPNNTIGYITGSGEVHDMDTSAFTDGQMVYLSAETAGAMTATAPVSPNYPVQVGVVLYAHGTQGKLLVSITRTAGTGGGSGTVTSVGITPGAGVTVSGSPVTSSGSITLGLDLKTVNGTSLLGSGNVTTPQGTVTSVGITGGTGIVVNNSPITSSGNMTVALASSGVVPGSYGSAAKTLAVTVDTTGRVTDIS